MRAAQNHRPWKGKLPKEGVERIKEKALRADVRESKHDLCPSCGKDNFVVSIFGSICSNCFYEE